MQQNLEDDLEEDHAYKGSQVLLSELLKLPEACHRTSFPESTFWFLDLDKMDIGLILLITTFEKPMTTTSIPKLELLIHPC
jgi:hypothetical protein